MNTHENAYQNLFADTVDTSGMSVPTEPLTKREFEQLKEELNFCKVEVRHDDTKRQVVTIENEKLKLFTSKEHFVEYYRNKTGEDI